MRIDRIEIQDLWSFGSEQAVLQGLRTHNVLIGKNNVGKSKVLAAVEWFRANVNSLSRNDHFEINDNIRHDPGADVRPSEARLLITATCQPTDLPPLIDKFNTEASKLAVVRNFVRFLPPVFQFGAEVLSGSANRVKPLWSVEANLEAAPLSSGEGGTAEPVPDEAMARARDSWLKVLNGSRGNLLQALANRVRYINGWRALRQPVDGTESIIHHLHKWRDPPQPQKHLRHLFTRVQSVFRELMLDVDMELRPEHTGQNLSIASNGRYVAIESCGDGVQHLLMIAFYLAIAPDSILLIEEPETHLHPELQRNLMRVLGRELKGQSIITTHSPVLLDSALPSAVFRIEHDRVRSTVAPCATTSDLYEVLDDLDVRPSDILQANIVIWVEGPTDRLFLKRCFDLRGDNLTEGLQYQCAYYGGRLRSHCTFDGSPELCNLLRMSRNAAMICDSDATAEGDEIDGSKSRLRDECKAANGHYWVTDGREIENYFPDEVLTVAYRELLNDPAVHISLPKFEKLGDVLKRQFPNPARGDGWKVDYEENKARIMPLLLKHMEPQHLTRWGISARLDELVARIREANPSFPTR